jgi:methionyl aminopeptidase
MLTDAITLKSDAEIAAMRVAGRAAASVLEHLAPWVRPGVSTGELDERARAYIEASGWRSATIGYTAGGSRSPFPGALCTSVNHVVCHGIPNPAKILREGDILNIDVTVIVDGWHGDTSRMYFVGTPGVLARRLVQATEEAMWAGIRAVAPGRHLGDIGAAIEQVARRERFSVVRDYCGHGIGRGFHEPPQVLHLGRPGTGPALVPGMCFTIEPMFNAGTHATRELPDGWTVVSRDRSLSAQWEHTVAVTADGFEVLTR